MPRCPEILGALFGRFEGRTRVDLAASSATLLLVAGVRSPPFFVCFRPVGPWDLISIENVLVVGSKTVCENFAVKRLPTRAM